MPDEEPKLTRQVHFIKGPNFETKSAEGVLIIPNSYGKISLTFYVERAAIAKLLEFEVLEGGKLGDCIRSEGKDGAVVELQQAVLLDVITARHLRDGLTKFLDGDKA